MPVKIPKSIQDEHSFLRKKFKVQTRAVKAVLPALPNKAKAKKEGDDDIER